MRKINFGEAHLRYRLSEILFCMIQYLRGKQIDADSTGSRISIKGSRKM